MNQFIRNLFDDMTKDRLKQQSVPELAALLKDHIWADLDITSPHSDLVEEVIDRLEAYPSCLSDEKQDENLEWAAKSYRQAMTRGIVACRGCGKQFALLRLFRCFSCGSYFCPNCAREHFGERVSRFEVAT